MTTKTDRILGYLPPTFRAVLYAGAFITGELLTVDGGGQLWGETWTTGKPDYFRSDS